MATQTAELESQVAAECDSPELDDSPELESSPELDCSPELDGSPEHDGHDFQPSGRLRQSLFPVALVSGLTLFAASVEGYHPFAEDGGLYVAGVKRLLDPTLYPHATAFVLEPMRRSLFAPTVAAFVRLSHLSLPVALLALHLASIWMTLFAAWMLAARCYASRPARIGAVTLLACWLSLPVAGTALLLMDPYLTARSFATPAMILALVGALDYSAERSRQSAKSASLYLCAASLLLAAAMHPLMAANALAATLLLLCLRSPRRAVRLWATLSLLALALLLAASLEAVARPQSAAYLRIAQTRTYWFVAQWRWFELLGLAAPLAILTGFARRWSSLARKRGQRGNPTPEAFAQRGLARQALARMGVAVGATSWLVATLFARAGSASHLVARLQPLRAFQVVYLILVLMLGAQLGSRLLRRSLWRWAAAMLLLGGVMFGVQRASFPHSKHLELPGVASQNPWVQAFLWARQFTPTDALFALDPDYINRPGEDAQCFRAIAERSALADYSKDGGEASIAPELTAEWASEQAAQQDKQQGLNAAPTTDAERVAALGPLGVTWLVLEEDTATGFDCPYQNASVKVCRLR